MESLREDLKSNAWVLGPERKRAGMEGWLVQHWGIPELPDAPHLQQTVRTREVGSAVVLRPPRQKLWKGHSSESRTCPLLRPELVWGLSVCRVR